MTRLATTPAILGILVGGMLAAGLAAGCGSNQVAIGSQNIDAAAGRGGSVAGGSGGSATGGVVGAGGVAPTGGTVGVGGAAPSGGITGVGSGGSKASGGTTAGGGSQAGGGTIGTGGANPSGGTGGTGTGCAPGWTLCCGQCLSPAAGVCMTPCLATGGAGPTGGTLSTGGNTGVGGSKGTGGVTGTGGTGGNTGKTCGGVAGLSCATGEFCDLQAGSCNVSDATGTCVLNVGVGCIAMVQPVCGCNGQTYNNDCERQVAGVSKQSNGACPLMRPTLPAACQVDGDCCVAIDGCVDTAHLVGEAEFDAMETSIRNYDSYQTACLACIPPLVQVQCQDGVCVGQKLSIAYYMAPSALMVSHCGYISLSDAGVTSAPSPHAIGDAAVDAAPAQTSWGCGH